MKITKLSTGNVHGYNLNFCSHAYTDYLCCAASTNYGLSGPGELQIFQNIGPSYFPVHKYAWPDAILDAAWKPFSSEVIATSSGDGNLQIWSLKCQKEPCFVIKGHLKEVSSIDWRKLTEDTLLLSSSWDESTRVISTHANFAPPNEMLNFLQDFVWDVTTGNQLCMFLGHNSLIYEAAWSPHKFEIFASVGGDRSLCLWDIRAPELLPQQITAHTSDVLTIDWSMLDEHIVATGGIDQLIKGWDLRQPTMPVFQFMGHQSAVRRARFSPFQRNILASVSYDFSTRFWDWTIANVVNICAEHTEFVYGIDFSPIVPGRVADCSWDGSIHIYEDVGFGHPL